MKKHLCVSLFAGLTAAGPSFACFPDPKFNYDDISSQSVLLATASVSKVDFRTDGGQSCWHLTYSGASYLYGKGENEFSVKTCLQEVYQIDLLAEENEGLDYLGFVQQAEVLIGVVKNPEQTSGLRYAIPSCWGPLHINLDKFSSDEREKFLQDIRTQVANQQ